MAISFDPELNDREKAEIVGIANHNAMNPSQKIEALKKLVKLFQDRREELASIKTFITEQHAMGTKISEALAKTDESEKIAALVALTEDE